MRCDTVYESWALCFSHGRGVLFSFLSTRLPGRLRYHRLAIKRLQGLRAAISREILGSLNLQSMFCRREPADGRQPQALGPQGQFQTFVEIPRAVGVALQLT